AEAPFTADAFARAVQDAGGRAGEGGHAGDGRVPLYASLVPTQLHRLLADPVGTAAAAGLDAVLLGGAAAGPGLLATARAAGVRGPRAAAAPAAPGGPGGRRAGGGRAGAGAPGRRPRVGGPRRPARRGPRPAGRRRAGRRRGGRRGGAAHPLRAWRGQAGLPG